MSIAMMLPNNMAPATAGAEKSAPGLNPSIEGKPEEGFDFLSFLAGAQDGMSALMQQQLGAVDPEVDPKAAEAMAGLMNPQGAAVPEGDQALLGLFKQAPEEVVELLKEAKVDISKMLEQFQESEELKDELPVLKEFALRTYQEQADGLEVFKEADGNPTIGLASSVLTPDAVTKATVKTAADQITSEAAQPMAPVFDQIQSMANQGGGKMTFALNPPELGQLEVEVITRGGKVEVEMTSDNHLAKHLLETNLPELKRTLGIQELQLGRVEVNVSDPGYQFAQDQGNHSDGSQWSGNSFEGSGRWQTPNIQSVGPPASAASTHRMASTSQLDITI